jgi:hypothetical protein
MRALEIRLPEPPVVLSDGHSAAPPRGADAWGLPDGPEENSIALELPEDATMSSS